MPVSRARKSAKKSKKAAAAKSNKKRQRRKTVEGRSAVNGEFVPLADLEKSPDTTVAVTRPVKVEDPDQEC
jgi:hypothetical protein